MSEDPSAAATRTPAWCRDPRRALLAILGVAFVLRALTALLTPVIAHDGARFTAMARYFAEGRWEEGLSVWPPMSPLYPLLILAFGNGAAVSVVLGTLSIVPMIVLARAIWGWRIAALTGIVLAVLPDAVTYGGAVMSEATFCFFFFAAMEFVRRTADRARWVDGLLAGVAGGFAVLTRPEGVYVLPALIGWTVLRGLTLGRWGRRSLAVAMATVAFLAVLSPYALWVRRTTGRWDVSASPFSQKLKVKLGLSVQPPEQQDPRAGISIDASEFEEQRDIQRLGPVLGRGKHYVGQVARLCGFVLFPFLVIGGFGLRRVAGDWFVFVVGLGCLIPPALMLAFDLEFSHRYLLFGVLFWVPIVAVGMDRVASWCARWVPERRRLAVAAAALALLSVGFAVKAVRPPRKPRRTLAEAGRWIRDHSPPRPVMLSMDRRPEHYAEGYSFLTPATAAALEEELGRRRASWIVIVPDGLTRYEAGYLAAVERRADLAHVVPASKEDGDEVRIYAVR